MKDHIRTAMIFLVLAFAAGAFSAPAHAASIAAPGMAAPVMPCDDCGGPGETGDDAFMACPDLCVVPSIVLPAQAAALRNETAGPSLPPASGDETGRTIPPEPHPPNSFLT